jgi:hypothetical protein
VPSAGTTTSGSLEEAVAKSSPRGFKREIESPPAVPTPPARKHAVDAVTRKGTSRDSPGATLDRSASARRGAVPCAQRRSSSTMSWAGVPLALKSRAHPSSRRNRGPGASLDPVSADAPAAKPPSSTLPDAPLSQHPGDVGCDAWLQPVRSEPAIIQACLGPTRAGYRDVIRLSNDARSFFCATTLALRN